MTSEFSELPEYFDDLEFSSPKHSGLSKFFEWSEYSESWEYSDVTEYFDFTEYSDVSEYSGSIKIFGLQNNFCDNQIFFTVIVIAGLAGGIKSQQNYIKVTWSICRFVIENNGHEIWNRNPGPK